jgi:hypothetical protein
MAQHSPHNEDPAEGSRSIIERELARQGDKKQQQGDEKKKPEPDAQEPAKTPSAGRSRTGL